MFIVKWVACDQEVSSIESESYPVNNPDMIVDACRLRLSATHAKNPKVLIDDFILFESRKTEFDGFEIWERSPMVAQAPGPNDLKPMPDAPST
jgi:hypothetical protein